MIAVELNCILSGDIYIYIYIYIQCALDIPAPSGMRNCAGISRVPVYRSSRK